LALIKLNYLWMEVTNRCNADCVYCGRQWAPPPKDMDLDLFQRIVDECPEAKIVQTQGFGEPLLYPHIIEAVKYAAKKGKQTKFYTNGSLLTEEMSRELIKAGLGRLIISVDDRTKKGYESIRRGLSWEPLLENIRVFHEIREKAHKSDPKKFRRRSPYTTIRMCKTRENASQINVSKAFWKKRVDHVAIHPEVDIPSPMELRETPYVNGAPINCKQPYQFLSVKSNGDLVMCCRDWFGVYVTANLHNRGVQEAYRSAEFEKIRESHKTGVNIPHLCHICKTGRIPTRYKTQ